MLPRAVANLINRNQKCMKLVLAYQRISSFYTRTQLQSQGVQDSGVTTSSVITFDTSLGKEPSKSPDILETKLTKAKSSDEVLQLTEIHSSIMNARHVFTAFSIFHSFIKEKPSKELFDVTSSLGFQQLCKRVMKTAHHLAPEEAITIFKVLSFLNVPSNSNIMQILCQVLRRNINSLPLNQIAFLVFLLRKQRPTPLVEALLMALPLVLQSQLDLQMDPDNLKEMVYCLEVATTSKLSNAVIQKLSDAILLKVDKLTAYEARTIIASLVPDCQFPGSFEQLVFKSFDILADDVDNITDKEARMLMSKLCYSNFFSRSFLMALVNIAVKRNWDLIMLSQLLNICEKFEFIPEDLLHYTMCKMQSHTTELCNDQKISLTNIISPFGLVGYEPPPNNEMWTVVNNCKKFEVLQNKSPLLFLKLNSEISILGGLPHPAVFTSRFLSSISEYIKKGRTRLARELCIIEWTTKIMNKNFPGPHLPQNIIQEAINSIWEERQKRNFSLKPFLKIGLGGDQFFETNLMTKYGHAIDHVILLRKGNYPIAVERRTEDSVNRETPETIKFVEDFIVPPESKILMIIVADESCFCKNSSQLKGWMKLKLNTLNKLGYLPLLIKSESWDGLLGHEKVPYLMREINAILKQSEQDTVNALPVI